MWQDTTRLVNPDISDPVGAKLDQINEDISKLCEENKNLKKMLQHIGDDIDKSLKSLVAGVEQLGFPADSVESDEVFRSLASIRDNIRSNYGSWRYW